jgi:hypothetical protein
MPTDLMLPSHIRHLERAAEERMTPVAWMVLAVVLPVLAALIAFDAMASHGEVAAQAVMCFEAGLCL